MHTFKQSINLEELKFDKIKYCQCYEIIGSCLTCSTFLDLDCFYIFLKIIQIEFTKKVSYYS